MYKTEDVLKFNIINDAIIKMFSKTYTRQSKMLKIYVLVQIVNCRLQFGTESFR